MSTPINQKVAPGFRFVKDIFPTIRGAGLSYYPFSSIHSGLVASWTPATNSTNADATPTQTVSITAGSAYLDGQLSYLAAPASVSVNISSRVAGLNYFYILLNPSRKWGIINRGTAPSGVATRANGDAVGAGDYLAQGYDQGEYFVVDTFYKRVGSNWQLFDPVFEAPPVPAQAGRNRTLGGNTHSKIVAGNFTVDQLEQKVYIDTKYPPYTNSNSKAIFRDCATLHIATLVLNYNTIVGGADAGKLQLDTATSELVLINNVTNP
jgi:hypothetical protein